MTAPDQEQRVEVDPVLEELVGEGRKYKSVADLAKAYKNADTFIETLKQEKTHEKEQLKRQYEAQLQQLREELDSRKLAAFETDEPAQPNQEQPMTAQPADQAPEHKPLFQTEDELFEALERRKNWKATQTQLSEKFGDKAAEKLAEVARESGVSVSFLEDVAKKSPKAFWNFFPSSSPLSSGVSGSGGVPEKPQHKTFKEYNEIRKTNPKLYRSLANEMEQAAEALGKAFYD